MNTKKLGYPLAMTTDAKKSKLKKMKPDAFLKKARKLAVSEGDRGIIDKFKSDIKSGEPMGPLKLYPDGREDGRHRATAAKELGLDEVPVIDERTAKALGGALASSDPNKFFSDIMKFSFAVLPLLRPGYLKEVPKQGFAHGGHVLEDDYPTHYLPEVGRQVMADGGSPEIGSSRFAALDPAMLVGTSSQPFRGGEAYTDAGGQKIAAPFVSGMQDGYPTFDFANAGKATSNDLPAGKNPFEDLLQFSWLSKLMGYADGGGVEGNVEFASPEVEQALKTAQEVADQPRPFEEEKKYEPFSVLPLKETKEGIEFDPYAGLLGSITRPAKYFYETMSGQKEMEPTSEEAIRAATDLAGSLVGGSAAFERPAGALASGASRVTNPLGMHSAGAEAARALPQERGTPEQVLAMLRKVVPEHEIEHSEIAKEIAGLPSVSKEDVAKHFESKLPRVTETIFGGEGAASNVYRPGERFSPEFEAHHDVFVNTFADDFAEDMYGRRYQDLNDLEAEDVDRVVLRQSIEDAQAGELPIHSVGASERPMSKFEAYSLPGGSNYREVVLHEAPTTSDQPRLFKDVTEAQNAHDAALEQLDFERADEINRQWQEQASQENVGQSRYTSSHFQDVPNYLAHVRMKDYDLPEGGKGLLVDEIQSDRAQQGRKHGFRSEGDADKKMRIDAQINDISQQKRELEGKIRRAHDEYVVKSSERAISLGYSLEDLLRDARNVTLKRQAEKSRTTDLYNKMEALHDQELALHAERNKLRQAVPSGPYMSDTNHWTDLAIKRALKEAIEGGYDRLMITPGREHAERYSLRKQVGKLSWSPDLEDLIVHSPTGAYMKTIKAPKEKLSDLIGKEAAENLISSENYAFDGNVRYNTLEGEGLEIGGEGMKGYYDKKALGRLEKILKKYDKSAKVGSYELPTTGEEKRTVHSIPITDALRRAVEEKGISAFARGGALDLARSIVKGDHHV